MRFGIIRLLLSQPERLSDEVFACDESMPDPIGKEKSLVSIRMFVDVPQFSDKSYCEKYSRSLLNNGGNT